MLLRHEPWELLNDLNILFDNKSRRHLMGDDSKVESSTWAPAVDIKEEPEQFVLAIDIPGVDSKDIEISMENTVLTIKGSREESLKSDKNSYLRTERIKGTFYRRFTLPNTADAEQIRARTKQGVLEITIGKKRLAQSRKIQIQNEE